MGGLEVERDSKREEQWRGCARRKKKKLVKLLFWLAGNSLTGF